MDHDSTIKPGMSAPKTYQITVRGRLNEHWREWFNGALINFENKSPGSTNTILTCQVRDQAELYGILNRLSSFNLVLLQLTLLNRKGETNVEE